MPKWAISVCIKETNMSPMSDFSSQSGTDNPCNVGQDCEISVVIPCLNEAETLEKCIAMTQQTLRENGIVGEVVIADSSTDASPDIAKRLGARVVHVAPRGYGNAIMGGVAAATANTC